MQNAILFLQGMKEQPHKTYHLRHNKDRVGYGACITRYPLVQNAILFLQGTKEQPHKTYHLRHDKDCVGYGANPTKG